MPLRYRSEIDGLRAIAVVGVILYHAQFVVAGLPLFPGGYLGVDVFFVISGYLISRLILSELAETSRFDFRHFYERRARRILPMLFTTLLVALPVGWLSQLPSAFVETSGSALSAVFFGSNFFFYATTTDYAAQESLLQPLLHTWSLSVEEQFYLVFPALALFLHRLRKRELAAHAALALASLGFAQAMTRIDSDLNFYLLPSRMWELLVGTLLALNERSSRGMPSIDDGSRLRAQGLPLVGLLAILVPMGTYTDDMAHPGLVTLLPVAGTAVLIRSSGAATAVRRLLTLTPIVRVGLISYSLYLWHFPIFACLRSLQRDPTPSEFVGGIVATLLLSFLSYRFIEQPFRNRDVVGRPRLIRVLAGGAIVVCALHLLVVRSGGDFVRTAYVSDSLENYSFDNRALLLEARAYSRDHTRPFAPDGRRNVLIVGNSHGRDLFNALFLNRDRFPESNFSRFRIELSCFAFESAARDKFFASPRYLESDVLLVSTRYSHDTRCRRTDPQGRSDVAGLESLIAAAARDGKVVVITGNSPEFGGMQGQHLGDHLVGQTKPGSAADVRELIETINRLYYRRRYGARRSIPALNAELRALAEEKGLTYLDRADFLCADAEQICFAVTPDGQKSFADEAHLTLAGAEFFGRRIAEIGWLDPLSER